MTNEVHSRSMLRLTLYIYFRIRIAARSTCQTQQSDPQVSGDDALRHFATEDTPAQFSRNESLSDISNVEEENDQELDKAITNNGKIIMYIGLFFCI